MFTIKTSLLNLLISSGIFASIFYGCTPCHYETAKGIVTVKEIASSKVATTVAANSNNKSVNQTTNNLNNTEYITVIFNFSIDEEFEKRPLKRNIENEKIVINRSQAEILNIAVGKQFKADYNRITQGTCGPPVPFSVANWEQIKP
jgi:hypothetical protein